MVIWSNGQTETTIRPFSTCDHFCYSSLNCTRTRIEETIGVPSLRDGS
jgi:hypothetical protein